MKFTWEDFMLWLVAILMGTGMIFWLSLIRKALWP